jgi:methionyl-tRNA synthetase
VPDDPGQIIYVWWDALANYITALGYGGGDELPYRDWWVNSGERVHIIGKGITRFHAVYWLALLLSAGQPLPSAIYVHEYLSAEGAKLSKSAGHAISPYDLAGRFGTDAVRWWLLRDVARLGDTDFTAGRLVACANSDLANGLGNLQHRTLTLVHRYRAGRIGAPPAQPRWAPNSPAPAKRSRRSSTTRWHGSTSAPPPAPSARLYRPATGSSRHSAPGTWPAARGRAITWRPRGWTSC